MMEPNRKTAFLTLLDIKKNGAYSNISLNENIRNSGNCDPSFVRELVYGVLKNEYLLDFYLKGFVKKGFDKLGAEVLLLLRLGAYQALFMDSVPDYASVSESVNLARKYAKGRENFINAVLRNLIRSRDDLPEVPDDDPLEYLSVKYSCKRWIAEVLTEAYGFDEAERYLEASNRTPELSVRVNVLKTTPEALLDELKGLGFEARKSDKTSRGIIVKGSGLIATEAFREGRFSVQDEASIMATDVLSPEAGMDVLDMAAAPGGKTVAIAELMGNRGKILACDVYEHKLKLIDDAALRSGVDIINTEISDGTVFREEMERSFDRVLCDVPCSGLGVLRRKPEIKYKEAFDIKALTDIQFRMLENSSGYLKPGGALVYSTCTVNPAENEGVTDRFLEGRTSFKKEKELHLSPLMGTDGFYMCKIIREA
ncbi:MAG: 16S rRNA (cytosine(967)-C(5))-methyltransferase RsmB [Firmicutes bacterium]|nr:16S rRNA (cytosine(967)-C(5))-methyltransferase RsmB [Bacillota bacterium]